MSDLDLEDIGTRYTHYRELLELWESALTMIDDYKFHGTAVSKKKAQLQSAIKTLRKQLDVDAEFEDGKLRLRRLINAAQVEGTILTQGELT